MILKELRGEARKASAHTNLVLAEGKTHLYSEEQQVLEKAIDILNRLSRL